MRHWTPEAKSKQSLLIRQWQPWKKAGVKTPEGKAISCKNAYKHGLHSKDMRAIKQFFVNYRHILKRISKS